MTRPLVAALTTLVLAAAGGARAESPYSDFTDRPIKALSAEETAGWLEGRGMGLALPAELNAHPGPRHVLDLADELGLTDEQRIATHASYDRMHAETTRLGARLVDGEARLDAAFAAGDADPATVRALTAELGALTGEIRWHHLAAHLEMRGLLTAEQIATYERLRGYRPADDDDPAACPHHGEHPE